MNFEFHPIANILPLIDGQAYQDLMADVLKHGVREPVWLYEGKILDGRNRYRAATAMGVECPMREYEGDEPVQFVVSLNLHRRHLSESQRAMVASKLEALKHGGDRGQDANLHVALSRTDAAGMLNVSPRSVASATKVRDEAPPALARAVESGAVSVSLAAQVAALPEPEKMAAAEAMTEQPEKAKEVLREAVRAHVANNSGNNEWYTPPNFIAAARETMGSIDTDPASSEVANKTVQAQQYFDAQADGLKQQWRGNVWMNPPYAQPLIADFAQALSDKYLSGEVEQACVLVNNGTETGWFQTLIGVASAVCLVKTRVKFLDPSGAPSGAPLQGQAVIYLGKDHDKFSDSFCSFGKVLYA